jgi:outer membrane protein OmpA-like peptidoglycan-associated protein
MSQSYCLSGQTDVRNCPGYSGFSKQAISARRALEEGDLIMAKVYLSAINRKPKGQELNFLYLRSELDLLEGRLSDAVSGYAEIYSKCPLYSPMVLFKWGSVLEELGLMKESKLKFEEYLALENLDILYKSEVMEKILIWNFRDSLINNPVSFEPMRIKGLSTDADEFLGILSPDESSWYFTRRYKYLDFKMGPAPVKRFREEFCQLLTNEYAKSYSLRHPFNQGFNEGGPTLTADNRSMAITSCELLRNGYKNCDIFIIDKYDDQWSDFQSLDIINQNNTWEAQPAFSANGDRIIFSSDRKGGYGGLDLYSVDLDSNGKWGDLVNLGPRINTSGDEKSPFIHADNEHLFFSSNGHWGLGDFDVFVVSLYKNKSPVNLGYPINTSQAEVGFAVSARRPIAYFSSNDEVGDLSVSSNYDFFQFVLPEKYLPDNVAFVQGQINGAHDLPNNLQLRIENLSTKKVSRVRVDRKTGKYTAVLSSSDSKDYLFSIESQDIGYTSTRVQLEKGQSNYIVPELSAKKLEIGESFELYSVLFESNNYVLSELDKQALKSLARYFKSNPSLIVELQGHTDNIGYSKGNLLLSEKRSQSVFDFLIYCGVDSIQVSYKGMGDRYPIASNASEIGRSKNRRTVFIVLNK